MVKLSQIPGGICGVPCNAPTEVDVAAVTSIDISPAEGDQQFAIVMVGSQITVEYELRLNLDVLRETGMLVIIPSWVSEWPPKEDEVYVIDAGRFSERYKGSATFTVPSQPGYYYLWVVISAATDFDEFRRRWILGMDHNMPACPAHAKIQAETGPELEVEYVSLPKTTISPGEKVELEVRVRNVGRFPGNMTIVVELDNQVYTTKQVTLNPGERTTVKLPITSSEPGQHLITVNGVKTLVLYVKGPAEIEISNIRANGSEVQPGTTVRVTVDVVNRGESPGTASLRLIVDGSVADSKEIRIDPGETREVYFDVRLEPGTHEIEVNDQGPLSVKVLRPGSCSVQMVEGPHEVAMPGDKLWAVVSVKNTGEMPVDCPVELAVGGETVSSRVIPLAGMEEQIVNITFVAPEAGNYTVTLNGEEVGEISVLGIPVEKPEKRNPIISLLGEVPLEVLGLLAVVVGALAVVRVVASRRRSRRAGLRRRPVPKRRRVPRRAPRRISEARVGRRAPGLKRPREEAKKRSRPGEWEEFDWI